MFAHRLLLALGIALALSQQLISADKPNIIFILTDDQTINAAGCYGNKDIITPHLDQLASEGVKFTNHYNTTSICMGSRCVVMTGLYEYRHGCNFDHGDLERRFYEQTYPQILRNNGYVVGFAGKLGFDLQGEKFSVFADSFDYWGGGPGQTEYETKKNPTIAHYAEKYPHCSRAYGAWAADTIKSAKATGKPFCLSISFKAPHLPLSPDPIDLALYNGKQFSPPVNFGVENAAYLSPQVRTSRAYTSYRFWVDDYQNTLRHYYALITGVDVALGMIRDALTREGMSENTVIIYTSDNGYNCGAHGFGDKILPYEEASKSPLVIYDPRPGKQIAGHVSPALTANADMATTILSLAGIPAADNLDGKDLTPLINDSQRKVRDHLPLFNFWGIISAQSLAIVTEEWKYIYWFYGADGMQPTEEFFHVGNDRFEQRPLPLDGPHADQLALLRAAYDKELAAIATKFVPNHNYDKYGVLFSRTIPWSEKAPLAKKPNANKPKKEKKPAPVETN